MVGAPLPHLRTIARMAASLALIAALAVFPRDGALAADYMAGDTLVVATDRLNIRATPGSDGAILRVLDAGHVTTVVDGPERADRRDWYLVNDYVVLTYPEQEHGWVAADFMALVVDPASGGSILDGRVATDLLNLRTGPGLEYATVAQYEAGTGLMLAAPPVAADGYDWYAVVLPDRPSPGWVAGSYVTFSGGDGGAGGEFEPGDGVRVAEGPINVRYEPGLDGEVFITVAEGAIFTIASDPTSADGYTWYKVHSFGMALPLSGNVGWVAGEFLAYDAGVTGCEGQGPCPTGLAVGDGIRVITDALNLRDAPGLDGAVLAVLPTGAEGVIDDIADGLIDGHVWLAITTAEGSGWVAREFVVADAGAGGAPEFAVGDEAVVTDGALNLRDGPGLARDVVDVMADGAVVTIDDGPVMSDGFAWYRVITEENVEGWAAGEFLAER